MIKLYLTAEIDQATPEQARARLDAFREAVFPLEWGITLYEMECSDPDVIKAVDAIVKDRCAGGEPIGCCDTHAKVREVEAACLALLMRMDGITTLEFGLGGEKPEREALRAVLSKRTCYVDGAVWCCSVCGSPAIQFTATVDANDHFAVDLDADTARFWCPACTEWWEGPCSIDAAGGCQMHDGDPCYGERRMKWRDPQMA